MTHADFERFKALGFTGNGFPAIKVGEQRSVGYEVNAWNKLLDSAQYPRESELPATYQYPASASLAPEDSLQGSASFHQPVRIIDASEVRPAAASASTRAPPGEATRRLRSGSES